jgi:hypothetical protein
MPARRPGGQRAGHTATRPGGFPGGSLGKIFKIGAFRAPAGRNGPRGPGAIPDFAAFSGEF